MYMTQLLNIVDMMLIFMDMSQVLSANDCFHLV